MSAGSAPRHTNRLIHETSPYLLGHAHNPVDWMPWGDEALARARNEDKPILLSIGYAACHWCHVMERESFEDEATAELMNHHFVCIKVDREERPDLDDIYMMATLALSGSGGWPMTVFLLGNQQPFFAGTYFPPRDLYGRPGFSTVLLRIAELWKDNRAVLESQAADLTEHILSQCRPLEKQSVDESLVSKALSQLRSDFDPENGGFGTAPKFPPGGALSLLLAHHAKTHDATALRMVTTTLDAMKNGGIYDHIGGGFARYSTDARWLVPHFEKMLYDNAQLAGVYCQAFRVTQNAEYARVARETLDYVIREMQSERGGYYSATDADSEGEEGKFFVFRPEDVFDVLDAELARIFCAYYDISTLGNWEGVSIPNTPRPLAELATELGLDTAELGLRLESARAKMYAARKQRIPPLLDDKILTSWNALMIAAMTEGYRTLFEPRYLESAKQAARFVTSALRRPDGGLFRTARGERAHLDAYLEDYAFLSDALIDLYEVSGETSWLFAARELATRMVADFSDASGGFFGTAHHHEPLIVRSREGHDGAIPNANAVAARALLRLSFHLDAEELREPALAAIEAYGKAVERMPRAFATLLRVIQLLTEPRAELVLVGHAGEPSYEAFRHALGQRYLPNHLMVLLDPNDPNAHELPLARGKSLVEGKAALYVCRNYACAAPLTSPAGLDEALGL